MSRKSIGLPSQKFSISESNKVNYPIELSINMLNDLKDPIYMNRFTFLSKTLEE